MQSHASVYFGSFQVVVKFPGVRSLLTGLECGGGLPGQGAYLIMPLSDWLFVPSSGYGLDQKLNIITWT